MKLRPDAIRLLRRIKRHILAEPKRYDQNDTISFLPPSDGGPACGTVGCVAGWVVILTRKPRTVKNIVNNVSVCKTARKILHLSSDQTEELFSAEAVDETPQTAQHARAGAAHIEKFIKDNS